MMILILFILGLCFGSFVNALVWRLHKQAKTQKSKPKNQKRYSVVSGRSMCVNCGHELATKDLIPVISWLTLRGKCRYCKKPISLQYPAVEIATAGLFVLLYSLWPNDLLTFSDKVDLLTWLITAVGLIALLVYDLKYMVLPNKIIFPLSGLAVFSVLAQTVLSADYKLILDSALGALIGGGLFYALFQISRGAWIGGGDVKLGFLLGLLLGQPLMAILMLFLASVLGTVFSIFLVGKRGLSLKAKIPFGPFLIIAVIITKLFGQNIIDAYTNFILGA